MKRVLTIMLSVALILTGIAPVTNAFAATEEAPVYAVSKIKGVSNKNTLKEVSVTVKWKDTGAEKYQVWISRSKNFSKKYSYHRVTEETSHKFINRLMKSGKRYYFRVRAYNDGQWGEYSPVYSKKLITTTKKLKDSNVSKCIYYKDGLR